MTEPYEDPIVAEVRDVRQRHAEQFDYDIERIFDDIVQRQATSGRKYVKFPPRRVEPISTDVKAE